MKMTAIRSAAADRRVIAPLLCGLCFLVPAGLLLERQQSVEAARVERDVKLDLLERLKGRPLQRAGDAAGHPPIVTPFVAADTATTAAAEADRLLRALVAKVGGEVLSSQATVEQDKGANTRIELQATIEGRLPAMQRMLFDLETGSPLIFIEDLALRPSDRGGAKKDPLDPQLQATITLSAYWRAAS